MDKKRQINSPPSVLDLFFKKKDKHCPVLLKCFQKIEFDQKEELKTDKRSMALDLLNDFLKCSEEVLSHFLLSCVVLVLQVKNCQLHLF